MGSQSISHYSNNVIGGAASLTLMYYCSIVVINAPLVSTR